MDRQQAGEAIFWALSGTGGAYLAQQMVSQLDSFQTSIGCSDPLRSTLARESLQRCLQLFEA